MIRIYFAGRMGFDGKNLPSRCYRPFDTTIEGEMADHTVVREQTLIYTPFLYTGPYRTGEGAHCGVHGDSDEYNGVEPLVFKRSLDGIRRAELVFAWIDDHEAYGTIAEIGYAHALGKLIVVGFDKALKQKHNKICDTYSFCSRENDMWFAASMADVVLAGTIEQVLAELESIVHGIYHERQTNKLLRMTLRNTHPEQIKPAEELV